MTEPRQIIRGTTYHVTRRILQQRLLLTPDETINNTFHFCLAYAAAEFAILVHAFKVMSNHYHLVVTDPDANLPRFLQLLNQLLAKSILEYRDIPGPLWHPGSYDAVVVRDSEALDLPTVLEGEEGYDCTLGEDGEDVERAMDYTFLNAVTAGLVASRSDWAGCWSTYRDISEGKVFRATRPKEGFSLANLTNIPDKIELVLSPPPHWADLDSAELDRACAAGEARLDAAEEGLRASRKTTGSKRPAASKKGPALTEPSPSPFDYPKSASERPKPWTKIRPKFAGARVAWRKIRLRRLASFVGAYRHCLRAIRRNPTGNYRFPIGTYWQRYFFHRPADSPEFCATPLPIPG